MRISDWSSDVCSSDLRRRVAHQQALHRQALLDASAQAAAEYEAIVEALTGAHRIALSRRDWLTTATAPKVQAPARRDDAERRAASELENYSPGWFARVLKDRKSGVSGKSVSGRVDHGGSRFIKNKKLQNTTTTNK